MAVIPISKLLLCLTINNDENHINRYLHGRLKVDF